MSGTYNRISLDGYVVFAVHNLHMAHLLPEVAVAG